MRLEDEDVGDSELVNVSLALEFLSYPGANGRDGHRKVVHGLHLGDLATVSVVWFSACPSGTIDIQLGMAAVGSPIAGTEVMRVTYSSNPFSVGSEHSALGLAPVGGCKGKS
jgi:hypothetical protein